MGGRPPSWLGSQALREEGAQDSCPRSQTHYPMHRLPLQHPGLEAHLHEARPEELMYTPEPADGCAALRLIEIATYELRVRPAGDLTLEGTLGEKPLEFRRIDQTWICTFSADNFVGPTELRLRLDGKVLLDLPLEVRSRKVDYLRDFRNLVDDLTDRAATLCFSVNSPSTFRTLLEDQNPPTTFLTYLVLRHLMRADRLPAAVRRIALQPDRRLLRSPVWRDLGEARSLSSRTLLAMMAHPEHLSPAPGRGAPAVRRALGGRLPVRLLDEEVRLDLDTPPNRFVACALRQVEETLATLEQRFRAEMRDHPSRAERSRRFASDCRAWLKQVADLRRLPFLQGLGPLRGMPSASPVLMLREGYREVRDAWSRMHLGGRVRWEALQALLTVPARDLPALYELWCFFALADALERRSGFRPDWARALKVQRDLYTVRLGQGRRASVPVGPYLLSYNRSFRRSQDGTWSVPLRPDYVVERDGQRWLFDAKYRLESAQVREGFEDRPPARRSVVRGDLYKMHTYLDAIHLARASFVLYPGDDFRAFHRSGSLAERPRDLPTDFHGVGAIPLLPGHIASLDEAVRQLL